MDDIVYFFVKLSYSMVKNLGLYFLIPSSYVLNKQRHQCKDRKIITQEKI